MPTPATDRPEVDLPDKDWYTYDDYQQLPEGAPYELIRGRLVMSPSPSVQHQRLVFRLGSELYPLIQSADEGGEVLIAPMDVHLTDETVVQPERTDRIEKKRLYEEHGVREYWIVDLSQETVEVFQNTDEGFVQHARVVHEGVASSTLLGDFAVELKDLF